MKQRILVIDDDHRHRNLVANYLTSQGFDALMAADYIEMQKQLERFHCDLLVLDINMAGEDGLIICQKLRAEGDMTPIIFLTGRDHFTDRVLGLECGADDYLAKPFEPTELVARVKAILRRFSDQNLNVQETTLEKVQFGVFILDILSRSLLCKGDIVSLSYDEFEILKILASTPGKPKSRNQIAIQMKGVDQQIDQRYIDMTVSRLRKRLKVDSFQPDYIQTVRGVGYVFQNAFPEQLAS